MVFHPKNGMTNSSSLDLVFVVVLIFLIWFGGGSSFIQSLGAHEWWINFITTKPCSPEAWKLWLILGEIIPFYGPRIQVSEL